MLSNLLPWDEEDALRRILRHHNVAVSREIVRDLSTLINWMLECERAKSHLTETPPPFLLTVLGGMGIYGAEVVGTVPVVSP